MVKGGGKSSATSATRKKHAKKTAGPAQELIPKEKKPKGKDKKKSKEPRKKVYISPTRPQPVQPDPLDTLGLAHLLPPDLYIVLKSFGKKDIVTKGKALEKLQSAWVDKCRREGDDSTLIPILSMILPVWLHHVSSLFVHSSRRIRILSAGLHESLLRISVLRDQLFFFLRETASIDQVESILGTWCMLSHDMERSVALFAGKSWRNYISLAHSETTGKLALNRTLVSSLETFISRTLLDPAGVYLHLNPLPPVVALTPSKKVAGKSKPVAAKKEDPELSTRTKSEDEEEKELDRASRLRIGAFGAMKWILESRIKSTDYNTLDDLIDLFNNPALWTSLHHAQISSYVDGLDCFGFNQPGVRKSAWLIVHSLALHWKASMNPILSIMSTAILRSAWVEPDSAVRSAMWEPLLVFLKEFPNAWELESAFKEYGEEDDDDSEAGESDEEDVSKSQPLISVKTQSFAYRDFLQFLELGCSGSPLQGYRIIVIILSTIPSSILASSESPISDFFVSFWAAVDGRALSSIDRAEASAAFLSSLLECTVFLVKRLRNHPSIFFAKQDQASAEARKLVSEQFERAWEATTTGKLKVDSRIVGETMANALVSLNEIDEDLFSAAWAPVSTSIRTQVFSGNTSQPLVLTTVKIFEEHFHKDAAPKHAAHALHTDIVYSSIARGENSLSREEDNPTLVADVAPLVDILNMFGGTLFETLEVTRRIDEMMSRGAKPLLSGSPLLLLAYFTHRNNMEPSIELWHKLLSIVCQHPESAKTLLSPLVSAAQNGLLPDFLKPKESELDGLANQWLTEALGQSAKTERQSELHSILEVSKHFISKEGLVVLLGNAVSAFTSEVDRALHDPAFSTSSLEVPLDIFQVMFKRQPQHIYDEETVAVLLPDLFILGYLLPQFYSPAPLFAVAKTLWTTWKTNGSGEISNVVEAVIKEKLCGLLCDSRARPSTRMVLKAALEGSSFLHVDTLDIFPSRTEMDAMLDEISPNPIHPSIAALDPTIPLESGFKDQLVVRPACDSEGFSSYARVVTSLLQIFVEDRQVAKENMWALRHLIALSIYADDCLKMPSAKSPVFYKASESSLKEIVSRTQQVTTYLLTSLADSNWHATLVNAVVENREDRLSESLSLFIFDILKQAKGTDSIREARVLRYVLQHIFSNSSKDEADHWVILARKLEKTAPQTSIVIVSSIAEFAPEPPRLDRYRNELAAGLLGISSAKANTEGLLSLRKLAATAPDPDSDIVFLSQLRAVNVMKACQQWIASDEGVDEDVESVMTLIFRHLVPILQNVPGAHWELIFDIIESNLEASSFSDNATLVTLARTLDLIIAVDSITSTNKPLRANWKEKQVGITTAIRDMAAKDTDASDPSAPRSTCREMALSIIQDLPASLMDENTLPTMCHLLNDHSAEVQKMAYRFLQEAAKTRTEKLVIEAGVDVEAATKIELPPELIHILQRSLDSDEGLERSEQYIFGYLLSWMITFDLFINASVKVRSSYLDQLRGLDIIATHFIPTVFDLLNLGEGPLKVFRLDVWSVDEFYISLYEPGITPTIQLLAAHLYYRALLTVPSLIRAWVLECKDRQLFATVSTYTSQHFSPVIIRAELANVKSPEAMAELADENLTIKVNTLNEITASYLVDDQQLEIALKMPSDWPLRTVEVLDLKKVGVAENTWRAWILGMRKWSQNGHIVDALSLFKKNISGHFEGQVECAICYSIISVVDYSLPKKPCKTCKNRFHSACLYKWFSTSHTSSCPLCRSDII